MGLIGVNVTYGYDTDFSNMVAPSDAVTRWVDAKEITYLKAITNLDGTQGSAFILNNGISPYGIEVRVTQNPTLLTASDTF